MRRILSRLVPAIILLVSSLLCVNLIFITFIVSPYIGKAIEQPLKLGRLSEGHTVPVSTPPPRLNSTETCPGLLMKEMTSLGDFQKVDQLPFLVYSAFLDNSSVIIVSLVRPAEAQVPLFCQLWSGRGRGDPLTVTPTSVTHMPEDHGRAYTSCFITCQLPVRKRGHDFEPQWVSLVTSGCQPASNVLPVSLPEPRKVQFTVCVTPLNYRYSRAYELVEMLEMNKLLGAAKLVFYNHSTGANVDAVLKKYSEAGEVDVHPWHLPLKTDTWPPTGDPDIHYFAQMAALNDCLYRYRYLSEYLVFTDLDEFVIPKTAHNWTQLVEERGALVAPISVFHIQSVFFRKEWPNPAKGFMETIKNFRSVILSYTWREARYLPHGTRSKFMVNPRLTQMVGIHTVWRHSGQVDQTDHSVAAVHHYRSWDQPKDTVPRLEDDIAIRRFGADLARRLDKAWSALKGVALDIDISTYGHHV